MSYLVYHPNKMAYFAGRAFLIGDPRWTTLEKRARRFEGKASAQKIADEYDAIVIHAPREE